MKHTLTLLSGRTIALKPVAGAPAVNVPGIDCLGCGKPLAVRGVEMQTCRLDDGRRRRYEARALEACCGDWVGTLVSETEEIDTIFGADEDDAVLKFGRARVYG